MKPHVRLAPSDIPSKLSIHLSTMIDTGDAFDLIEKVITGLRDLGDETGEHKYTRESGYSSRC